MKLPKDGKLKTFSRELRRNQTKEERHLWYDFLKDHRYQFLRQKIVGAYILDFFCSSVALAIELDGSQHYEGNAEAYDEERTLFLNKLGIEVLRFTNYDVNTNFYQVCNSIDKILEERSKILQIKKD